MGARPLTCPRCGDPGVAAASHSLGGIARAIGDRLVRIVAGFIRLVLALVSGGLVFFACLVAFDMAGWAHPGDWIPLLGFIPACVAIVWVGRRSERLFRRRQFCPNCGETLTRATPARKTRELLAEPPPPRNRLAAIGHDTFILVAALIVSTLVTFTASVVMGELGLSNRPNRVIAIAYWLLGCAVFALLFVRASDLFRASDNRPRGLVSGARRFFAALAGAALLLLTSYAVVYFGRLDAAFGAWPLALAFLTAPAALLVLHAWPRLYRPLARTPQRTVGSAMVLVLLVAGQGYAIETVTRGSACDPLYATPSYASHVAPAGIVFVGANATGVAALGPNGDVLGQIVDLAGSSGGTTWISLSPDRKRVAFDVSTKYNDGSGPGEDILAIDMDGSHFRRLVSGYPDIQNWSPVIDPSGTSVYFLRAETVSDDGVSRRTESIERLDLNTRRCSLLASVDGVTELALSPDGRTLAYVRLVDDDTRLWRINTDGSDAGPFFGTEDNWVGVSGPRFSPDGSSIAFSAESRESHPALVPPTCGCGTVRPLELFIAPSAGGGATAFARTDLMPYGHPAWSSDGKRIAFADNVGRIEILTVGDGSVGALTGYVNAPEELLWVNDIRR
ncbi:MAG: hypothetical protein E6J15_08225 [Chloroflexi bacterium]|nr:MAG: hypothetical protein E6J15_08225 [Chloroflexota bacterium]